jgi:hypothetical protein
MIKTIVNMLVGAFVAALVSAAFAVTGQPPVQGFQTPDGTWLLGLSGGQNQSYEFAITAKAGGTQTTCTNIAPGIYLNQVDTVASGNDSICLPFAVAGTNIQIRNNGAQTMAIFAQSGTNLLTASTDTINNASNASSYTVVAQNSADCFAAKNGSWSCVQGH